MRTWYKAWYGTDVPEYQDATRGGAMNRGGNGTGMMGGGMGGRMTDLVQPKMPPRLIKSSLNRWSPITRWPS